MLPTHRPGHSRGDPGPAGRAEVGGRQSGPRCRPAARAAARVPPPRARAASPRARRPEEGRRRLGPCPLCGAMVVEQEALFRVQRLAKRLQVCDLEDHRRQEGEARTAQALLRKGRSPLLKGFTSKAGKKFDAASRWKTEPSASTSRAESGLLLSGESTRLTRTPPILGRLRKTIGGEILAVRHRLGVPSFRSKIGHAGRAGRTGLRKGSHRPRQRSPPASRQLG